MLAGSIISEMGIVLVETIGDEGNVNLHCYLYHFISLDMIDCTFFFQEVIMK